jgi:hypothetical protein
MSVEFTQAEAQRLATALDEARQTIDVLRVELADARSTLQAYQQHPSTGDICPPHGIERPKLTVVR